MNWLSISIMWVSTAVAVSVAVATTGSAMPLFTFILPAIMTTFKGSKSDKEGKQ